MWVLFPQGQQLEGVGYQLFEGVEGDIFLYGMFVDDTCGDGEGFDGGAQATGIAADEGWFH